MDKYCTITGEIYSATFAHWFVDGLDAGLLTISRRRYPGLQGVTGR